MSLVPPILEVVALAHRFGARIVLDGASLTVAPGEVVALMGPNGSGKSTALAVLGGLLPRQEGTIRFDGRELKSADRAFRTELGFVFQAKSLNLKLSARQNLSLAATMHGLSGQARQNAVLEALAHAALADRADEPTAQLSGGMQRRLDIARALIHAPRLLLLDEPTTGLDERAFLRTWQQIRRVATQGEAGVLLTTHRPDEAARCDRVVLLDEGRVVAMDTPERLIATIEGDIVTLVGHDPASLADLVTEGTGLDAQVEGDRVLVSFPRGHEAIVKIVESLPPGRLDSVSLRRPSLGDVFLRLTGRTLDADDEATAADPAREAA